MNEFDAHDADVYNAVVIAINVMNDWKTFLLFLTSDLVPVKHVYSVIKHFPTHCCLHFTCVSSNKLTKMI